MTDRTKARDAFPLSKHPGWLDACDVWSARTGVDLATLGEHQMPCVDCNAVLDMRNLAEVFAHEEHGDEMSAEGLRRVQAATLFGPGAPVDGVLDD